MMLQHHAIAICVVPALHTFEVLDWVTMLLGATVAMTSAPGKACMAFQITLLTVPHQPALDSDGCCGWRGLSVLQAPIMGNTFNNLFAQWSK